MFAVHDRAQVVAERGEPGQHAVRAVDGGAGAEREVRDGLVAAPARVHQVGEEVPQGGEGQRPVDRDAQAEGDAPVPVDVHVPVVAGPVQQLPRPGAQSACPGDAPVRVRDGLRRGSAALVPQRHVHPPAQHPGQRGVRRGLGRADVLGEPVARQHLCHHGEVGPADLTPEAADRVAHGGPQGVVEKQRLTHRQEIALPVEIGVEAVEVGVQGRVVRVGQQGRRARAASRPPRGTGRRASPRTAFRRGTARRRRRSGDGPGRGRTAAARPAARAPGPSGSGRTAPSRLRGSGPRGSRGRACSCRFPSGQRPFDGLRGPGLRIGPYGASPGRSP